MDALLAQLNEAAGAGAVSANPLTLASHAVHGARPVAVIESDSVEALARAVRAAAAGGAAVVPWGGGTRQSLGKALALGLDGRPFIVASTRKLDRVLQYEPADMTISVGAGMTFAQLEAALRPNGQMLPMDVALPGRSTIGGAVATGADGPRRLSYGTFRDVLLGMSVIEAGGRISKAGGMTVKNVSGYDLMKLYHGSLGTLVLFTSINVKLYPRPLAAATVRAHFDALDGALALVDALHASQLTPVAVELVHESPLAGADAPHGSKPVFQVAVRAEGLPEAVERHVRDVPVMARTAGATDSAVLRDAEHDTLWARIADLAQAIDLGDERMMVKLTCLPAGLGKVLGDAQRSAGSAGVSLSFNARALNGVAYVRARGRPEGMIAFHRGLIAAHPRVVVLGAPRDVRTQVPLWGNELTGLEVMRRIKREFDPRDHYNPGRFVV